MSGGGESDIIVFTRFGKEGIGAIFVPLETKGVTPGKRETLLGFRGIPSTDLFFDNVIVPIENLILSPGNFGKLMSVFNLEKCGIFNLKIDLFSDFSYCLLKIIIINQYKYRKCNNGIFSSSGIIRCIFLIFLF